MPEFEATPFHETYYQILDHFADGLIKKLMVTVPPQHGKSEGSTRRLPSYLLGKDPNKKIAVGSYSTPFAQKFNREVQRIIDTPVYHEIFPDTNLNSSNIVTVSGQYLRNASEFEVVGYKGGLKSVGRGGPLTGSAVDVMIMDDLYKDAAEGNSPVIRQSVWEWYSSVVTKRLHNDSQQLIVFTRWHKDDLIGMIEEKSDVITITDINQLYELPEDFDGWIKINFEAIKTGEPTPIDDREEGEALYPSKHSVKKLLEERELDPETFECMNQGNPISQSGLLYRPFDTYRPNELPQTRIIKSYTDTADKGKDYLCSIHYAVPLDHNNDKRYILDVVYTDEPMEITEPLLAKSLDNNKVNEATVESNNGGRGFARAVEKLVGPNVSINWFHQSDNKESRIVSNAAAVNRRIVFPEDWATRWPKFHDHLKYYKKLFNANTQDGAPDVLTGIIEADTAKSQSKINW